MSGRSDVIELAVFRSPTMHERHIARADRHIVEGEERLARQRALVERLAADGYDTTAAETLLQNIADLLEATRAHRRRLVLEMWRRLPPSR